WPDPARPVAAATAAQACSAPARRRPDTRPRRWRRSRRATSLVPYCPLLVDIHPRRLARVPRWPISAARAGSAPCAGGWCRPPLHAGRGDWRRRQRASRRRHRPLAQDRSAAAPFRLATRPWRAAPYNGRTDGRGIERMLTRARRIAVWSLFSLVLLVGSGVLLVDRLMPTGAGLPCFALPVVPGQTPLDQELEPLLARHPGKTGAILLPDGLDAFASRAMSARQAGRSLDLQYYIWHDDLTGHLLMYEAWKAAERGVRVRLLLDD